jgi:hypothetical protein
MLCAGLLEQACSDPCCCKCGMKMMYACNIEEIHAQYFKIVMLCELAMRACVRAFSWLPRFPHKEPPRGLAFEPQLPCSPSTLSASHSCLPRTILLLPAMVQLKARAAMVDSLDGAVRDQQAAARLRWPDLPRCFRKLTCSHVCLAVTRDPGGSGPHGLRWVSSPS